MLAALRRVEAVIAAFAYLTVTILLLLGIAAREFYSTSIWGSEKMAVFAAIIAAFLGLTLATSANAHLRPQFADAWWPKSWRGIIARLGDLLSALMFVGIGMIAAYYVADTYNNNDRAIILYWPLWIIQLVIPYAFFSSALRYAIFALRPDLKPQPELPE